METVKKNSESKMKKAITALAEELNGIRTGRASASLFEKIKVSYYDQTVTIKEVASISVPEARLVVIQPWDRTVLPEIEKAIQKSELSINPNNDGKVIRISIPPLTEERRKDLVKSVKKIAEQSRVSIRNVRRDANEELKKMAKDSKISEDESKRGVEDIQKITDKYIEEVNKLSEEKEKEIMEV
jgi:ribosome recycling factor